MADFYGPSSEASDIEGFASRFDEEERVLGRAVWKKWIIDGEWLREDADNALDTLRIQLREAAGQFEPECPRVFVSHRQHDNQPALTIAWLANQVGFEFWLDLLDPQIQHLTPSQRAQSVLIASLVEVALLNCTHVIAVLSNNTRGTLWVPYEYGRVKEKQLRSRRTAVWLHPNIVQADEPEYTVLGVRTYTKPDVLAWLGQELTDWKSKGKCSKGARNKWNGDDRREEASNRPDFYPPKGR